MMSEYRDDRQGLLQQIADLETALAQAERRAHNHVVDAIRAGELEHENADLVRKVRELEERRIPLVNIRPWVAATAVGSFCIVVGALLLLI